jgi:hypothetical protein
MSILWDIVSGLLPNVWGYLAAAGAAVLGALGIYFKGRSDANAKRDAGDAKAYRTTTKGMQDADAAMGDDPAVLRDSLRQRDPQKR